MSMRRLSYSNVMSTIAVVLAIGGGTAYAASTINGSSITNHSITGKKLKNNTLTGTQIKESTLKGVNASSLGGVGASHFVQGSGSFVQHVDVQLPTATSYTNLVSLPGLGLVAAQCSNSGNDLALQFTNTTTHPDHFAWTYSYEDDSSHLAHSTGNVLAPGPSPAVFAFSNNGHDSGFEIALTLNNALATHGAQVFVGGVTQSDSSTNCQVHLIAITN
ncbi:MAG: hypothetical protein JO222_10875 [Frankiales bacterium]|nr:hypothetical protein [Frankiales bacterium]